MKNIKIKYYILLIICLKILLFNIFYLMQYNKMELLKIFKNNDYYFINNTIISFWKISKILSNKFVYKINSSIFYNIFLFYKYFIFKIKKKNNSYIFCR